MSHPNIANLKRLLILYGRYDIGAMVSYIFMYRDSRTIHML